MNLEAPDLLARSQAERERIEARRRATPQPVAAETEVVQEAAPVPEPIVEPQVVEEPQPSPLPLHATLTIRLETALSPGVLTVYREENQVFRSKFRFVEAKGLLRSLTTKPGPGSLEEVLEMQPGDVAFRVYVSLKKSATQTFRIESRLERGDSRTLLVTIDENGTARTALQ